jgi:hypothetical protein
VQQARGAFRPTIRSVRWGLPWLTLLAISASLAYAMTVAIAGHASAGDALTTIAAVHASATTPAAIHPRGEGCDTSAGRMQYVGLNTWIPAAPCQNSPGPSQLAEGAGER